MRQIRPFVRTDIPQVADIHRRIFGVGENPDNSPIPEKLLNEYTDYFERIFFQNPWYDESITSLVFEDRDGKVTGFLGVMPRKMFFRGEVLRAAISSQFVVERNAHAAVAAAGLMKTFLSGPQDLSLTDEANNASRRLWEGLGGVMAPLHSFHWTRILRPTRYAGSLVGSYLNGRMLLTPLATKMMVPIYELADSYAAKKLPKRYSHSMPKTVAEELRPETLLTCLKEFQNSRTLWPGYDAHSLNWILQTITPTNRTEDLRMVAIRNAGNNVTGWYVYQLNSNGMGQLLQLVAKKGSVGEVLNHLFYDAWSRGACAISGRFDPAHMEALSENYCGLRCGAPWMLAHSKNADLLGCIQSGDTLLSMLEGEWCIRFKR